MYLTRPSVLIITDFNQTVKISYVIKLASSYVHPQLCPPPNLAFDKLR